MYRYVGVSIVLLASVSRVASLPAYTDAYNYMHSNESLYSRMGPPGGDPGGTVHPGETPSPSDLEYITKMAAIGDSYSAGIGSGRRLQGPDTGDKQSGT